MTEKMRAACFSETGGPDVIEIRDVPVPRIGPDEVLVRIQVSTVNPIDTYLRSGSVATELPQPYIPGCDFSGEVVEKGANVAELAVGDQVWGSNQGLQGRQGTSAEFVAVDSKWVYRLPPGTDHIAAAAGSLTGITAHLGLFLHGQLRSGETVFVNGGTGGVGSAVVQFATAVGAFVITTCGTSEKQKLAESLGADVVLNYRHPDYWNQLAEFAEPRGGVDLWYETHRSPDPAQAFPLLKKRGRMVLMAGRTAEPILPVGPFYTADLRLLGFAMFNASADEQRAAAGQINDWLQDGKYRPLIGREFPLEELPAAHRLQEAASVQKAADLFGKIVIRIG